MTFSHGETVDGPSVLAVPSWQARALERSLADTRARSVERLSQFVAAARSLAEETSSASFTVQQIVSRSGQSLKSFYRYFEGKDDVLLALLEEDIAVGALFLHELIERFDDPVDRVRGWLVGLFDLMAAGDQGYVRLLVREHQRLSESRPAQMDVAVEPFLALLRDELGLAEATGALRPGEPARDASLIFHLALTAIRDVVGGRDDRAPAVVVDHLWRFVVRGIGP
jgi:AcrR family transcriptional regulator